MYFNTVSPHIRTFKLRTSRNVNVRSGVSEIVACPPSPIADDPSALPFPLPGRNSSCLFTDASPCMPTVALYYGTLQDTVL